MPIVGQSTLFVISIAIDSSTPSITIEKAPACATATASSTIEFLTQRGIPVMGHVGLTPQAVNILGGYGVRGKSEEEARSIVEDAVAVAQAGAFSIVIEGVLESIAIEITNKVDCPTIGIGASAQCDGQVLVTDDMLGMFDRVPKFVKRYQDMAGVVSGAVKDYADEVRSRSFPTEDQIYAG